MQDDDAKLELIAFRSFPINPDLIHIIDFLNKSLKSKKIMFGLSKDKEKNEMVINIYEF